VLAKLDESFVQFKKVRSNQAKWPTEAEPQIVKTDTEIDCMFQSLFIALPKKLDPW
jgi:hypothetical protein